MSRYYICFRFMTGVMFCCIQPFILFHVKMGMAFYFTLNFCCLKWKRSFTNFLLQYRTSINGPSVWPCKIWILVHRWHGRKKKKKPLHSLAGKCYSRSGKIFARTHQVSEWSANHECMLMSSWVNFWVKRGIWCARTHTIVSQMNKFL